MNCIMTVCEGSSNSNLAIQALHEGIQEFAVLLPKLVKYLYFSKLKNNFVIEQT